jgi:hypothetical protein
MAPVLIQIVKNKGTQGSGITHISPEPGGNTKLFVLNRYFLLKKHLYNFVQN